jgi:hypothetical protein
MLVADMGADILVADILAARSQFEFVHELGGYIAAVGTDHRNGRETMTVEFRVPHEHTGRVAGILRTEFGELTYINALSADVSVRNARLRRELAGLEESLGERSGAELAQTTERIELLHDMIAFQLEREAYLFVTVHLFEVH